MRYIFEKGLSWGGPRSELDDEGVAIALAAAEASAGIETRVVAADDRRQGLADPLARVAISPADLCSRRVATDTAIVVAPDHRLAERVREVQDLGMRNEGSSEAAIALCADKLKLSHHLSDAGVRTPRTIPFRSMPREVRVVCKPRFGCGSEGLFVLSGEASDMPTEPESFVCQPIVDGTHASIAVDIRDQTMAFYPLVAKTLMTDGGNPFAVAQCTVRAGGPPCPVQSTVSQAIHSVPGLRGYVGVDLVIEPDGDVTVIEINPRLTSSLVGYVLAARQAVAGQTLLPAVSGFRPSFPATDFAFRWQDLIHAAA